MTAPEIRQHFLEFFREKRHRIVDSAPLVTKDDPTLLFVNSGMAPFKDYFLGTKPPLAPRVADTQRCLRVSGKHNDLEEVGRDSYHHTLFEMLGNWSFGDYFKPEAIAWAWELLTERLGIAPDRLYVSVFAGDAADGLGPDEEAARLWRQFVAEDRILRFDRSDNFWEMGDTGPCGPCSEIHVDLRGEEDRRATDGRTLVNADHPQVVEIWNLVFMQYDRRADGSLAELPARHVDTGMGFERLCMALEGKTSNYETSVFAPLLAAIEAHTGRRYGNRYGNRYGAVDGASGQDPGLDADTAMRVCADHVRAVAFAIADGTLPGNTGAGYVIRRILRRAVRYYYSFLDRREPLLHELVGVLAEQFAGVFDVLAQQRDFVAKVILEEERGFLRTLASGLERLGALAQAGPISGADAFELYDTFGFPIDLTQLVAEERGVSVDMAGFEAALREQKDRSRAAGERNVGDWTVVAEGTPAFVGYDRLESPDTRVLRYRTLTTKKGRTHQLVLAETPFYAEGGGQVGDRGTLEVGGETIEVRDTTRDNDLIVHAVSRLPAKPEAPVVARVDPDRRRDTERNHTATHLLQAALREVLGEHVRQRGSLVDGAYLRFDFSHFSKVTDEELARVEAIVNARVRATIPREEARAIPIAEAEAAGATMLFGEKYGDTVRMVTFDPGFSRELCGGTHVPNTGSIGQFRITSESSVAAGIRRIEAVTGAGADAYVRERLALLDEARAALKNPQDLVGQVNALQDEARALRKELERLRQERANALGEELAAGAKQREGYRLVTARLPSGDGKAAKALAFRLENQLQPAVVVLGLVKDGRPQLTVAISKSLTARDGFHAGQLVKRLAAEIGGGGGGQPFFAAAGGSEPAGVDAALSLAAELLPA